MLEKFRKNNKKGFTLVELIVVLVILAILAALLIPALTGYIDKAKEKQIIAETRQIVMAAQTLVDEKYANLTGDVTVVNSVTDSKKEVLLTDIQDLAEIKTSLILVSGTATCSADGHIKITITSGKVSEVEFWAHGIKCKYDGKEYKVKKSNESFS